MRQQDNCFRRRAFHRALEFLAGNEWNPGSSGGICIHQPATLAIISHGEYRGVWTTTEQYRNTVFEDQDQYAFRLVVVLQVKALVTCSGGTGSIGRYQNSVGESRYTRKFRSFVCRFAMTSLSGKTLYRRTTVGVMVTTNWESSCSLEESAGIESIRPCVARASVRLRLEVMTVVSPSLTERSSE